MNTLIFILILIVLVLVHEFGHFFAAKKFGIRVDEFGFGFPPKIFGFKRGETEYTFNLFPIGGFVKIFGEDPNEENMTGPDSARSFVNKPRWQQAIVLLAGVFMNFILAWLLLSIGFMSGTMPVSDAPNARLTILAVEEDSPANKAGVMPGSRILSVEDLSIKSKIDDPTAESFISFIRESKTESVALTYEKSGKVYSKDIILESKENKAPQIGVAVGMIGTVQYSFFKSFYEGLKKTSIYFYDTVIGLVKFFASIFTWQANFSELSGPVGMVGMVKSALNFGIGGLIYFSAIISVSLSVLNVFPFPALDGGRLFFLLIEKVKGSRISPKYANMANMVGFGLLILLMLVVTYHDIIKLQ